jgi:hypothetical protein
MSPSNLNLKVGYYDLQLAINSHKTPFQQVDQNRSVKTNAVKVRSLLTACSRLVILKYNLLIGSKSLFPFFK